MGGQEYVSCKEVIISKRAGQLYVHLFTCSVNDTEEEERLSNFKGKWG